MRSVDHAPPGQSSGSGGRVIFINRVYWPATAATAQLLTDLAEGLVQRGWAVHVIASGETSPVRNGVVVHGTGPAAAEGGMLARARAHRSFARAADAQLSTVARPNDLVVLMTDPPMLGSALMPKALRIGAKVIHWVQDIYPEIAAAHFGGLIGLASVPLRIRRNAAWRRAAACVPLGGDMAGLLSDHGVPRDRISIIPNWAPRELHTPASESEVAAHRVRRGLGDKFIVAYSGNLGRVHEFATILKAAALLSDDPRIVFLFIGDGPRFKEIAAAAERGHLKNIRLLPPEPRSGLTTSLRAADAHLVTLLPAYARLVYPSKLAGVLAAARPVLFVGPCEGEIARLVERENCGKAFPPGAAAELARHIRRLATEETLRREQGFNGRAVYEKSFTSDSALSAWDRLLRQVSARG